MNIVYNVYIGYLLAKNIILFHLSYTYLKYEIENMLHVVHTKNESMNNLLKTKRRLLYLKTQFVPRSKHFTSRL